MESINKKEAIQSLVKAVGVEQLNTFMEALKGCPSDLGLTNCKGCELDCQLCWVNALKEV